MDDGCRFNCALQLFIIDESVNVFGRFSNLNKGDPFFSQTFIIIVKEFKSPSKVCP